MSPGCPGGLQRPLKTVWFCRVLASGAPSGSDRAPRWSPGAVGSLGEGILGSPRCRFAPKVDPEVVFEILSGTLGPSKKQTSETQIERSMDFGVSKRTQRGFGGEQTLSVALFLSLAAVYLAYLSMWVPPSFLFCCSPSLLLPLPLLIIHVLSRAIPQLPQFCRTFRCSLSS